MDMNQWYSNSVTERCSEVQLGPKECRLTFAQRVASDWKLARENLERSVQLQAKYYDKKRHRDVQLQGR